MTNKKISLCTLTMAILPRGCHLLNNLMNKMDLKYNEVDLC